MSGDASYRAGDSLGVVPSNDPHLVAAVLEYLGDSAGTEFDGRTLQAVPGGAGATTVES